MKSRIDDANGNWLNADLRISYISYFNFFSVAFQHIFYFIFGLIQQINSRNYNQNRRYFHFCDHGGESSSFSRSSRKRKNSSGVFFCLFNCFFLKPSQTKIFIWVVPSVLDKVPIFIRFWLDTTIFDLNIKVIFNQLFFDAIHATSGKSLVSVVVQIYFPIPSTSSIRICPKCRCRSITNLIEHSIGNSKWQSYWLNNARNLVVGVNHAF